MTKITARCMLCRRIWVMTADEIAAARRDGIARSPCCGALAGLVEVEGEAPRGR